VILQELLQALVRVATDLPEDVAALFGQLVHVARQLLSPLIGERGNGHPHQLAVRRGVQAEV